MAADPFERIGRPRHPDVLTPAEWEVLAGVRAGRSNREIARERACGLETVRFHLRSVRRKLGISTRDGLRAWPGRPAPVLARARSARTRTRIREQIPLLETRDMKRALAFYVDALGFEIVARWPEAGEPGWAALASGGARLMLRKGRPSGKGGAVTPNLYVEGIDAFHHDLVAAGHRCSEPEDLFYGAREFSLRDPDGNALAVVEFAASEPGYLATKQAAGRRRT